VRLPLPFLPRLLAHHHPLLALQQRRPLLMLPSLVLLAWRQQQQQLAFWPPAAWHLQLPASCLEPLTPFALRRQLLLPLSQPLLPLSQALHLPLPAQALQACLLLQRLLL
jgi:hypothetical protein